MAGGRDGDHYGVRDRLISSPITPGIFCTCAGQALLPALCTCREGRMVACQSLSWVARSVEIIPLHVLSCFLFISSRLLKIQQHPELRCLGPLHLSLKSSHTFLKGKRYAYIPGKEQTCWPSKSYKICQILNLMSGVGRRCFRNLPSKQSSLPLRWQDWFRAGLEILMYTFQQTWTLPQALSSVTSTPWACPCTCWGSIPHFCW